MNTSTVITTEENPREQKLEKLRTLITEYAAANSNYVPYSYLRKELSVTQPLLQGLLVSLAAQDNKKGKKTIDALVTREGVEMPADGHYKTNVAGRKKLKTPLDREKYHYEAVSEIEKQLGVKIYKGPKILDLTTGETKKFLTPEQYLAKNPGAVIKHSGKKVIQKLKEEPKLKGIK